MTPDAEEMLEQAHGLHQARRFEEAMVLYRQVLALSPDDALCRYFLGLALAETGALTAAAEQIRRAIALEGDVAEYHFDLGRILLAMGDCPGAVAAARQAVTLSPDYPEALYVLGNACSISQQFDEGIVAYRRLLELRPGLTDVINNLGMSLLTLGRVGEAVDCFDRLLDLAPADAAAHSNRIYAMHFSTAIPAVDVRRELERWNARHARPLHGRTARHAGTALPGRPLRVGYVSPDFRDHVVGWNMISWVGHHDREYFHVTAYSGAAHPDAITQRLRGAVQAWRDISAMPDDEVARQVAADGIDILVDLAQHTSGNRLLVFARRPAPIQVAWLGYPGSTGLEAMDCRLSDPFLDTDGSIGDYSEQTLRLPRTYWCYQPGGETPEPGSPPLSRNGFVTFGCLNQFQKVSVASLDLWREILNAVPESRLLLHAPPGSARERVSAHLATGVIDPGRIHFVSRMPWDRYIRTYQQIDVALDPFPYCGGVTTCDALWMGVPVITLAGRGGVSRSGVSILNNAGLPELVAATPERYLEIAQALAADPARIVRLRQALRLRLTNSPLMDPAQFAAGLEAAYRQLWREGAYSPSR